MNSTDGYSSAVEPKSKGITFEDLLRTKEYIESLRKDLCYVTNTFIKVGTAYAIEAVKPYPELIACHPNDLEEVKRELKVSHRLIPLHEYAPEEDENFDEAVSILASLVRKIEYDMLLKTFGWNEDG